MNELTQTLLTMLKAYTHFPQAVLMTQIERLGKSSDNLSTSDLAALAPAVAAAVSSFTNPLKGEEVKKKILTLR